VVITSPRASKSLQPRQKGLPPQPPLFGRASPSHFLKGYRSAHESPSKLVFPNGIPRASQLRKGEKADGIAYRDGLGRHADFHALRYTWATFLQRNGISQRFAMKLMRGTVTSN